MENKLETNMQPTAPYLTPQGRDLRLDFIRGVVMWILIINHMEIFSLWNYLVWERIGVVSGGEGFVIVSGIVLGLINRKKIDRIGLGKVVNNCIDRASQLYRVNIFIIVSVLFLQLLPFLDASVAMTFHDRGADKIYPLYPSMDTPVLTWIAQILLLRCGPHQFQIMGLYVILIGMTPVILWLFGKKRVWHVLAVSWIVYFYQIISPSRPTQAQFEYGFPLLAWQLIYIHGMAVGYHWHQCAEWLRQGRRKQGLLGICAVFFVFFWFFTLHNPSPKFPEFMKLHFFEKDLFYSIYHTYFRKNQLGILRIMNYAVILVLAIHLMSKQWPLIQKLLGWYFVPVGQATLYAFIIHVYMLILFDQLGLLNHSNIWLNTAIHTMALAVVWVMVRFRVGFKWIPR